MDIAAIRTIAWVLSGALGSSVTPAVAFEHPGHIKERVSPESPSDILPRLKVFLGAGDYRRAIEACQRYIDEEPSVESYVLLAYVYQALDGYLMFLVEQEDYVKVAQLSLSLMSREFIDLIDPPAVMPRMAQELIREGIRQQFDVAAAMANRLDRSRTDELWSQQSQWRQHQAERWWAGIPPKWNWQ